jgi:hypothetical protein
MGNEIVFIICSPINSTTNSYAVFNPISYFSLNPSQRHFLLFYFGQRRQKLISGQKTIQLPSTGVHFLACFGKRQNDPCQWEISVLNSSLCGLQLGTIHSSDQVCFCPTVQLIFSALSHKLPRNGVVANWRVCVSVR